jgi:phage terminase small subunit
MALNGKMQAYAAARAQGLRPLDAAAHAGYSGSGIKVTTSRIEARVDVQAEIKRLKKGGITVTAPKGDDDMDKWGMRDAYANPLELMLDVMNNPKAPKSLRYQAAKDALPYCHPRKEGGKKEEKTERAEKAAGGKFKTAARPSHLRIVGK